MMFQLLLILLFVPSLAAQGAPTYEVSDDLGFGRLFDGIGALSGGGTSKLLINYKEPERSQILDYLFKPKFGASLQSLKVEIGGDDQSTDGTEASHMHEEWDENYNRGYEWWLMKEAKKRNPNIKLLGLSWAWPHWLGDQKSGPYKDNEKTAMYTIKWILGAKTHHNLTIDYIGIWNERPCTTEYIMTLKRALVENKLDNVRIIGCDSWWDSLGGILANKTIMDTIYAFGVHYPGATSPKEAIDSNMTLWSSEDYSTFNDEVGGGCWARVINQNYVSGYMTSTIAWNLIASYYFGLPYEGDGLMTAVQPWSGYYEIKSPIWVSAHTTQFTEIGWKYLKHGRGVGLLDKGGSYVSLVDPDSKYLTIVIETMTRNHSICIRPFLPDYKVSPQKAIFKFGGSLAKLEQLNVWMTQLKYDGTPSTLFKNQGTVQIKDNRLSLSLAVDAIYTLTTVSDANHGDAGEIPKPFPFVLPYEDNFQNYALSEEPYHLTPQIGTWEIVKDESGQQFARQMVLAPPVSWAAPSNFPFAVIGDNQWTDLNITAKVRIPRVNATENIFIAIQIQLKDAFEKSTGIYFWLNQKFSTYSITTDMAGLSILDVGQLEYPMGSDKWYLLSLAVQNQTLNATLDGALVTSLHLPSNAVKSGFAAIGSSSYGYSDISYLYLNKP